MKRLYQWIFPPFKRDEDEEEEEEIPFDIWSHIINFYYHLKYTTQWNQLKAAAASCRIFVMPVDKIEIPLYPGYHLDNTVSISYKTHRLFWSITGDLMAVSVDTFEFLPNQPSIEIPKRYTGPVVLINGALRLCKQDYRQFSGSCIYNLGLIEPTNLVGTLNISFDALPGRVVFSVLET